MFHTLAEAKNRHHMGEREPRYRIAGERVVARGADRIIAASESEKEMLIELYSASPTRLVRRPLRRRHRHASRPLDDRDAARRSLGLDPDLPVLLFVGRIEPLKGIDVLIRAASQLDGRFQLVVVGGDEKDADAHHDSSCWPTRSASSGKSSSVTPFPTTSCRSLQRRDICVVPSYYESFGLVALEAMACGVPVSPRASAG